MHCSKCFHFDTTNASSLRQITNDDVVVADDRPKLRPNKEKYSSMWWWNVYVTTTMDACPWSSNFHGVSLVGNERDATLFKLKLIYISNNNRISIASNDQLCDGEHNEHVATLTWRTLQKSNKIPLMKKAKGKRHDTLGRRRGTNLLSHLGITDTIQTHGAHIQFSRLRCERIENRLFDMAIDK